MDLLFAMTFGIVLGGVAVYLYMKSSWISRTNFDQIQQELLRKEVENSTAFDKITDLQSKLKEVEAKNDSFQETTSRQREEIAEKTKEIGFQKQNIIEYEAENKSLQIKLDKVNQENSNYIKELAKMRAENESLASSIKIQKEAVDKLQETSKLQFENIANKILEQKTEKFTQTNRETLDSILKPLGENINSFKEQVEKVYENEARERTSLNTTIKMMMEQSNKISQEANNLATALKGSTKVQGDWGEMILERILENSGLTEGREYYTQMNFKNEEGENQRPDIVLQLPKNQKVVIDSKVSLNSYEKMTSSETSEEQKHFLDSHILAMKAHIDTLAKKQYHKLDGSLDFTIMFVPIESAFLVAMQNDANLWNYAYNKQVIILSPTNLIAYLKLISEIWDRTYQNENADKIAKQAADLYSKFVGFTEDLIKLGKNMDTAKRSYDDAMNKLCDGKGNVIKKIEKFKDMRVKSTKSIPSELIDKSSI